MKRILILITLLSIFFLCSCETKNFQQEPDINTSEEKELISEKLLHTIESEYKKESEYERYLTTAGMIELANKYKNKWDAVSDEYYEKIISVTKENFKDKKDVILQKLNNLKASYEEYEKSNLDLKKEIYNLKYSGGSIIGPLCANELYELRKNYALEIVDIYEKLTFDMEY